MVFIFGVLLPVKFTILHAALRLRNLKNKVSTVVWKLFLIKIFVQISSVAEMTGVSKRTPMAVILAEWGVEPNLKYLS